MTAPVVTREQAGLRAPRATSRLPSSEGSTLHYGGGALGGFPWDHSRCPSIWRAWQAYHMDSHGWSDIAYSTGVCIHGFRFQGRGRGVRTAANGTNDGNNRSHAICYMAGVGEALTDAARAAILDEKDDLGGATVWTHDQWKSTACPGDPLRDWHRSGLPAPQLMWAPPPVPKMGAPLAALAVTPSGAGYIEVDERGGVYCFGDALFFGSLPGLGVVPNAAIVDAAITPSGGGYWLAGADGGVYTFGDARYLGGMGGQALNAPVSAFAAMPSGAGYRLAALDGGVFTFGDAGYHGNAAA